MLEAIGSSSGPQRTERHGGTDKSARSAAAPAAGVYDIPASPPADLLTELDRAASVIDDLAARQVTVHFDVDEKSGKVQVQVLDGQGNLVREIPATRVLDVLASGNARGIAVNAVG